MKNIYHLSFYYIFLISGLPKNKRNIAFTSSVFLGFIVMLYFLMFLDFTQIKNLIPKWILVTTSILIILLNSFYFMYKSRYLNIIENFENLTISWKKKIITLIFLIFGLVGYPLIGFIISYNN